MPWRAATLACAQTLLVVACTRSESADATGPRDAAEEASDVPTTDVGLDALGPDATSIDARPPSMDAARTDAMPPRGDGGGMRREGGAPDVALIDGGITLTVDVFTDPVLRATELLARPEDRSISIHVVPSRTVELYYEYGTASGAYTGQTAMQTAAGGEPTLTALTALTPSTRYFYRMRYRAPGEATFAAREEHSFVTQRPRGATFSFTVQADSHLDDRSDYGVYQSTLANILRDQPDFHFDLGDTFMCEKHTAPFMGPTVPSMDAATVDARYAFDRAIYGRIGHSVPVFLVNGNHEGESGWFLNGTPNNLAVWATLARKRYFANPEANAFFSSTTDVEPLVGARQAFYAFEWGDALFISLDPYWYTRERPSTDRWRWTLGESQYRWLRDLLARSTARYKFVFLHHLLGGVNSEARGGVEAAPFFEWGGANEDRTSGFATRRPGWAGPIHQLLRDARATAVFHGHDHVYVRQELDGIVYQEVPQPSASNFNNGPTLAMEGGYASGTVVSGSGHLRVTVSPANVTVDFVRATPPPGTRLPDAGGLGHSYTILPR